MKIKPQNNFDEFSPVGAHAQTALISGATTLTIPPGADKVLLCCTTQNVRFTLDGTTPAADTGFILYAAKEPLLLHIGPNVVLQVIEVTATATLDYQFGR